MSYETFVFYDGQAAEIASNIAPYGGNFIPSDTAVLVNCKDGDVHAAVIFNHFENNSVEATMAVNGFVSPAFIKTVYQFIFETQGKQVLLMWTSKENNGMNRIHRKLGHQQSGTCPHLFGDEDGVLWTMTRTDWMLKSKFS